MAYNFIEILTKANFTRGNNGRKWIVIHYTGNRTDKAVNNGNYFKTQNRGASAHYFVDETDVVQVVKDENTSWAVGRNYGSNNLFGSCTNSNSISIEMCSTDGKIADNTYKNTVELTKSLMAKYGIDAAHVVRHWDVCSKCCPGWNGWGANGCDSSIWDKFKADIVSGTAASTPKPVAPAPAPASAPKNNHVDFTYAVKAGGRTYPAVTNLADYAGVRGKAITDIAIKCSVGSVKYRVHVKGGSWLPYVTGYNWSDYNNGYAGNGKPIDAVEVIYYAPSGSAQKAQYRVSPLNCNYYSWQYNNERGNGQDGYAGCFGKTIDRFQLF